MLDTPQVTQSSAQLTAVIRLTIPRSEIRNVMGPCIAELMATVGAQGIDPATTVARTVYHGGYEGLGAAWGEFDAWIKTDGHKPGPDPWECYIAGPESGPDPANWRTELNRPLVG
jgi:hypothetical protein